jgi:electron transfer flavoprotein alpha subunit
LKIVVCLKQVPRLDQVRFDERNRIVREDVEAMTNPLDLRALGHALALREETDGEVIALTMGPPAAREVLDDALQRGADRALHLVDKRFGGADTLATARAVARALGREEPDLVLCGRSTLDGATAQVGPQVAELAELPHLTQAIELEAADGELHVERETERGTESWTVALPAVVSVERGPDPPEAEGEAAGDVDELDAEALGGTPRDYGTRGSPTFVQEVREMSLEREAERLEGAEDSSDRLAELLAERKSDAQPAAPNGREYRSDRSRAIWVLAERDQGERLHPVSFEGLACARTVADDLDAAVVAVLMCAEEGDYAAELAARGADQVLVVRDPRLDDYASGPYAEALCRAVKEHQPYAVIGPWTAQGRDYVPRVAARLGVGLTGDFVALEVADADEDHPDLLWIKPAWAGTVQSPIIAHTTPSFGTLRPGVFEAPEPQEETEPPVETFEPGLEDGGGPEAGEQHVEIEEEKLLDSAAVVVCVGEELDEDTVEAARELAGALGGSLGATAAAVEAGLAPPQLEVGVLKRSLSPLVYLALGVREEEPLDAVRAARTIVTVHADADAPAHGRADLAVVAEPGELVPKLLERVKQTEGES